MLETETSPMMERCARIMHPSLMDIFFAARSVVGLLRLGFFSSPPLFACLVLIGFPMRILAQEQPIPPVHLDPVPVYHMQSDKGVAMGWSTHKPPVSRAEGRVAVAFEAIIHPPWPPGLVPIYATGKNGETRLSRRPRTGWENWTEPIFFALPPREETNTGRISGRWEAIATRGDGSKEFLVLELSMADGKVLGRFSQDTDHRFAFITGGTFVSNQLELSVEYHKDRYRLLAEWKENGLTGNWFHEEGLEKGTWRAWRPNKPILPDRKTVPLKVREGDGREKSIGRVWSHRESSTRS